MVFCLHGCFSEVSKNSVSRGPPALNYPSPYTVFCLHNCFFKVSKKQHKQRTPCISLYCVIRLSWITTTLATLMVATGCGWYWKEAIDHKVRSKRNGRKNILWPLFFWGEQKCVLKFCLQLSNIKPSFASTWKYFEHYSNATWVQWILHIYQSYELPIYTISWWF